MSKKYFIGLVRFLVIAIMVLASTEFLVRILKIAPPLEKQTPRYVDDQFLPYKNKPFLKAASYTVNSRGMADEEHDYSKPKDVFRVLGIGDSFTQGVGVHYKNSYLVQLEKLLNDELEGNPRVEIIKAGIAGFSPYAERLMLEHYGLRYSPDLITVGFVPNDIIDTHYGQIFVRNGYLLTKEAHKLGGLAVNLYLHSHAARLLFKGYLKMVGPPATMDMADVYMPNGYHEDDWQAVEAEYLKMIALAKSIGARILFLHIPHDNSVPSKGAWENTATYTGERLRKFANKHGALFADALPIFKKTVKAKGVSLHIPNDGHCNEKGYRLIAETLNAKILKENLIATASPLNPG